MVIEGPLKSASMVVVAGVVRVARRIGDGGADGNAAQGSVAGLGRT